MMTRTRALVGLVLVATVLSIAAPAITASHDTGGPVLVYLSAPAAPDQVAALRGAGLNVGMVYENLPAVSGNLPRGRFAIVERLDFVKGVREDTRRMTTAMTEAAVGAASTTAIANTWNLDFIDREKTTATGSGVYVAVLDGGLVPQWRDFLDGARVRIDLGRSFTGANGNPKPDQLENDRNGHGMAVAATIIGYKLHDKSETGQYFPTPATGTRGEYIVPGVAPMATIIPVKVCDNGVYCWDSSIFSGLDYAVGLRLGTEANGELEGMPIVVNLSLGGPFSSEEEEAVYEYVTSQGVLVVASAGNDGPNPMGWPGAYPVVISVGVGGWRRQFFGDEDELNNQWWMNDVPEGDAAIDEWFMVWWSAIEHRDLGQDLDVVATGRFMFLPYLLDGKATPTPDPPPPDGVPSPYSYISGTSFSAPTVTGIVALMLSVKGDLTQAMAEEILEKTAMPIPAGSWEAGFPFPHDNAWDDSKSIDPDAGTQTGWGLAQADDAVAALMSGGHGGGNGNGNGGKP